jgi:hypothetical protein
MGRSARPGEPERPAAPGRSSRRGACSEQVRYGLSLPNIGDIGLLLGPGTEAGFHGWDGFFLRDHVRMLADVPIPLHDLWLVLAVLDRTELRGVELVLDEERDQLAHRDVRLLDVRGA